MLLLALGVGVAPPATPCPPGGDCGCPPYWCIDIPAARAAKAAKKAQALKSGLPERLAKVFDELPDCLACVERSPDWPHIVVEMDQDALKAKGQPSSIRWRSQPWSREREQRARDMMREGTVKSFRIVLARYPCRCCEEDPQLTEDQRLQSYWEGTDGWNESLNLHEDSVIEKQTDPNDVGPDPPDLTQAPTRLDQPLERCRPELPPPSRHVTISCEACLPLKDEHDRHADRINEMQIRLRTARENLCMGHQMIDRLSNEIEDVEQLASTPETQARLDDLYQRQGDTWQGIDTDESRIKEIEAGIAREEAARKAVLARLIECEETCRGGIEDEPQLRQESGDVEPAGPGGDVVSCPDCGTADYVFYPHIPDADAPADGDERRFVFYPHLPAPDAPAAEPSDDWAWLKEFASQLNPPTLAEIQLLYIVQLMIMDMDRIWTSVALAPQAAVPGGGERWEDGPYLFVTSRGESTGQAFDIEIVGRGTLPRGGGFAVVEPLDLDPEAVERLRKSLGGRSAPIPTDGYCLEQQKQVPSPGTVYRFAPPEVQRRNQEFGQILEAASRVRDRGGLHPDSDPDGYFHSIRQWALWAREGGFDERGFAESFAEHTKKNVVASGRSWSDDFDRMVRGAAPGRWRDIQAVLQEAATRSSPDGALP